MILEKIVKRLGKTVATGALLITLAFQPTIAQDSKILFTTYRPNNNNTVMMVDADGSNPQVLYEGLDSNYRGLFSPNGQNITFHNYGDQAVVMNREGDILAYFQGGARSEKDFIWESDSTILCGRYYDGIYRFNLNDSTFTEILNTLGFSYDHNPAPHPGKIGLVHHQYGSHAHIRMMNPDGSELTQICDETGTSYDEQLDLTWMDDNHLLFKIDPRDKIFYVHTDSSEAKKYDMGFNLRRINVSPDKEQIGIIAADKLYFVDAAQLGGDTLIANITPIEYPRNMAWSGQSKYYAVHNNEGIRIFDRQGQEYMFNLDDSIHVNYLLDWSKDDPGNLNQIITSVDASKPQDYQLYQNYPNPFNPTTTIEYRLDKESPVTMSIYNILGMEVRKIQKNLPAGMHKETIDMKEEPSGVYFYRLHMEDQSQTKKMMLLK